MDSSSIPASVINAGFVDKIERGFTKEAAATATSFIRQKVREGSFVSRILTEQPIDRSQLDKDEDLDIMKKIIEIEPDSTATWISFKGMPNARYLKQGAAVAYFGVIATEEVVKNIYELKTRDNDVRKIISDNHVKDILEQQDGKFIERCRDIVGVLGGTQNQQFASGLNKNNFVEALKILPSMKLPNACCLVNEATAKEFLKWNADDVGFEIVKNHYESGLTENSVMGIKFLTTIKNDIVTDGEMFIFAPEEYLGKFFVLQDTLASVETKGLYVKFFAHKCLSIPIVNTKSIVRAQFY